MGGGGGGGGAVAWLGGGEGKRGGKTGIPVRSFCFSNAGRRQLASSGFLSVMFSPRYYSVRPGVQFSSVQFKMVYMGSAKPICALPYPVSQKFPQRRL